jgi:hypothetical protein
MFSVSTWRGPNRVQIGVIRPKKGHKFGCNALNPKPGSNLGYGPQNGVRIGLFTLKLDLWRAFGYMGFSVEGLLAFGYMGFSVITPLMCCSSTEDDSLPAARRHGVFGYPKQSATVTVGSVLK